jgi:hypothetical protein
MAGGQAALYHSTVLLLYHQSPWVEGFAGQMTRALAPCHLRHLSYDQHSKEVAESSSFLVHTICPIPSLHGGIQGPPSLLSYPYNLARVLGVERGI